jgi:tetratricopeptide (TPR) repeat protein
LTFLAEATRLGGNKTQSQIYIEEALEILRSGAVPESSYTLAVAAHCQAHLGLVWMDMGDYDQARKNLNASLAVHTRLGTHYGTLQPLMGLGQLAYLEGEFIQARDLFLQAMQTAAKIYDRRGMAQLHNLLGAVYEEIVNISDSHHHVISALELSRETGDRRLTGVIVNNLAYHQMRYLHQPAEAIHTYQECLEIFSEIADLRGLAYTSYDISRAYLMVGLVDEAWSYCLDALHTAMTLDSTALILHALHGFAYMFAHLNSNERALRLCYLILNHPAAEPDTRKRAIVSRVELETSMPPELIESARQWGQSANLADVIDQLLTDSRSTRP